MPSIPRSIHSIPIAIPCIARAITFTAFTSVVRGTHVRSYTCTLFAEISGVKAI